MNFDLIKPNANGQLEFDFEALEAITSKEFVEEILSEVISTDLFKRKFMKLEIVQETNELLILRGKYSSFYKNDIDKIESVFEYTFYKKSKRFKKEFDMGLTTMKLMLEWAKA